MPHFSGNPQRLRATAAWALLYGLVLAPDLWRWWQSPQDPTPALGSLTAALLLLALAALWRGGQRSLLLWLSPLVLGAAVDMVHLLDYGEHLGPGGLAAILDTHPSEAREFLTGASPSVLPVALVWVGGWALALWLARPRPARWPSRLRRLAPLLLAAVLIDYAAKGASRHSYPLSALHAASQYLRETQHLAALRERAAGVHFDAHRRGDAGNAVYVLVLGESLRRDHMSLYGYPRPTTPRLAALDHLLAFRDVSAPANYTRNALKMILSPATPRDLAAFYTRGNLVQLAREAGFEVVWLSNQGQYGKHDTEVTKIATDASERHFTNTDWDTTALDGRLLPLFRAALRHPHRPLLIVVHLLGSHADYRRRFPPGQAYFSRRPQASRVDYYDDSVRYTDRVLARLITDWRAVRPHGCLVFTSDHAEYLADDGHGYGHGFSRPHRQELEVPLLVTCSARWRAAHPRRWQALRANTRLPVTTASLFQGMADLLDIDFPGRDPAADPFSPAYQPPQRRLVLTPDGDPLAYEDLRRDDARLARRAPRP